MAALPLLPTFSEKGVAQPHPPVQRLVDRILAMTPIGRTRILAFPELLLQLHQRTT
jgi:hypothetical protein